LNNFCSNCNTRNVPDSLKKKFNENYKPTFLNCPQDDPNVAGCLIKNSKINWSSFCNYLFDHKMLTVDEASTMATMGLFIKK